MENNVYLSTLYDYYGELLTEKQKNYFESYYFDNLSLQEIADDEGVSRNAVHKTLTAIVDKLNFYEDKLNLYKNREKINDKEDDDEEYSKCHHKRHRHGKGKGKCHHKYDKDKCKCHKHGHGKCRCHHKKVVFNIEFSPAEELLNYAELFEKGYLTKEEFEKKKEELLNIEYKI